MNIEGLGKALVEQLLEKKIIKKIPDIYRLRHEDLANLERMGSKSSQNVLDEIEKSKKRDLLPPDFCSGHQVRRRADGPDIGFTL